MTTTQASPLVARGDLLAAVEAGLRADPFALTQLAGHWGCSESHALSRLGELTDARLAAFLDRLQARVVAPLRAQIATLLRDDSEAADILDLEQADVATMGLEEAQSRLAWLQGRARAHAKGETFWIGRQQ